MSKGRAAKSGRSILAVILCIPLAFIVYFAISYSSETVSLGNISLVTVEIPGGTKMEYSAQEDIDFLVSMLGNAKQISTAIRDVSGEDPVYIIYDRGDKTLQYKFYPTLNLSGCLLSGPDGKLSLLDSEDAGKLLLHDEFAYLYNSYALPQLSVVSGEKSTVVSPSSYEWKFKKSDGIYYDYTLTPLASGDEIYSILKDFENTLSFSSEPDELTDMKYVTSAGVPLSISGISSLDFSVDTLITVSFTAKWSSVNNPSCYGSATYSFDLLYDIPAEITLDKTEVTQGGLITVSATHLNENEEVTLSTMLTTSPLIFGMTGEDTGVALLPIPLSNTPGTYTLSITSGSSTVEETITVLSRETSWTPIQVSTEDYNSCLSPEKLAALQTVYDSVTAQRPEGSYFTYGGTLRKPVGDKTALYSFGQTVNFGNTEITGDAGDHTVTGTVYSLSEGTSVRSAQAGKVVYSGRLDATGNTVIIYHGYGIYTYYYHLAEATVAYDAAVTDGEIIGIAGSTGYTGGKTVLGFEISIDGHFIDPAELLS